MMYFVAHLITSILVYIHYEALSTDKEDPKHKKFGFYVSELPLDRISKPNAIFASNLNCIKNCFLIYIAV